MILLEKRPEFRVHSERDAELSVERTEIALHDVANDKVRVQITVHNLGTYRSAPTTVRLESAPLGAFVRWQPLGQLLAPALEPGESHALSTEVARVQPVPLGDFNSIPPKTLLTAVNSPDQPFPAVNRTMGLLGFLRRGQKVRPSDRDRARSPSLAPDLWDLLGRGQPHWAGNINVFVGSHPVERHLARALRVYPGRTNQALFLVGRPGRREAFAFELLGLTPDWKAALYDVTNQKNLLLNPSDIPIEDTQWVESSGGLVVMLAIRPPVGCLAGKVEVHVTRQASGKKAIVEFDLDPDAQGTGCYYA